MSQSPADHLTPRRNRRRTVAGLLAAAALAGGAGATHAPARAAPATMAGDSLTAVYPVDPSTDITTVEQLRPGLVSMFTNPPRHQPTGQRLSTLARCAIEPLTHDGATSTGCRIALAGAAGAASQAELIENSADCLSNTVLDGGFSQPSLHFIAGGARIGIGNVETYLPSTDDAITWNSPDFSKRLSACISSS